MLSMTEEARKTEENEENLLIWQIGIKWGQNFSSYEEKLGKILQRHLSHQNSTKN